MTPVELVWLIPLLPLAALALNFLVVRPLDVRAQNRFAPAAVAVDAHGRHDAAGAPTHAAPDAPAQTDTHSSAHGGHDTHATGGDDAHAQHATFGGRNVYATAVSWIALLVMVAAMALAWAIAIQFLGSKDLQANGAPVLQLYDWFNFGPLRYAISFRVDSLTVVMLVVVTTVSTLVHLYSMGYMADDPGYSRFFIELSLFTFSMLILVLGSNFLVLFIGWELVGLSSYLLIGFFYGQERPPAGSEVPYPPPAQVKAFVTTRMGDFGFMIGILILFVTTGTFEFTNLNTSTHGVNQSLVTLAMILVFCGAVGKSAQFPLHVWLPDAMAGPTPVSALIHAATMVAAGVYLVARLFPIYSAVAGPQSLLVVGYVGTFTALFAATIALTQNDIKGVLAYSTISQLGYMFAGLAVAENNSVGIFHLFTHAFFKALLFLGAGSVIHALHANGIGAQDLRRMGGLAKWLPITAGTMLIANLAISGIPPFSGFFSKDAILATAHERGYDLIYYVLLFTAFLTAFYMFRLYFLAFGGRGAAWGGFWGDGRQYRGVGEPHESPLVMWLPLALLAIPSFFAGWLGVGNGFADFLTGGHAGVYMNPLYDPLTYLSVAVALVGIGLAWLIYGVGVVPANALTSNPLGAAIYRLLKNHYYVDQLYDLIIKYGALALSTGFVLFDRYIIDGVVNGSARTVQGIGSITRRSETGFLQNYGAALFGGALLLMIAIFFATGAIGR